MAIHESTDITPKASDLFHGLVMDIKDILGPSSGINSADVDDKELRSVMEEYLSNETEWQKYALCDGSRPYTRNLVDKGNGKSNLVSEFEPIMLDLSNWFQAHLGLEPWKIQSSS